MRRHDKKKHIKNVNILFEERNLLNEGVDVDILKQILTFHMSLVSARKGALPFRFGSSSVNYNQISDKSNDMGEVHFDHVVRGEFGAMNHGRRSR
jgi:hypothetical protein